MFSRGTDGIKGYTCGVTLWATNYWNVPKKIVGFSKESCVLSAFKYLWCSKQIYVFLKLSTTSLPSAIEKPWCGKLHHTPVWLNDLGAVILISFGLKNLSKYLLM